MASDSSSAWHEVWDIVRQIPSGQVMNYGQVAALIDRPLSARSVGWAMHDCPDDVPWHRVVSVRGGCLTDRVMTKASGRQRKRLEGEGVRFEANGRVDMSRYQWQPDEEP